ncbi:MAG: acyl carrier protein [Segetibacter sp.]|nr:acyl carrier protein [Segetibacter sp.]
MQTETIVQILSKILEVPETEIHEDMKRENFENWDSIQHLTLIAELEETFRICFEPEEIEGIKIVKDLTEMVAKKTGKNF